MAEAKGCASSGHRGSYTHKALPQRPQKCLLAGLVLASSSSGLRTLARGYVLLSLNEQRGGLCSEVYGLPTTSRGLAADGAVAGLVRVGCRGVDAEAHPATMTRAAKFHRILLPDPALSGRSYDTANDGTWRTPAHSEGRFSRGSFAVSTVPCPSGV